MKVIEVKLWQRYGDFDILQIDSVWINEKIPKNQDIDLPNFDSEGHTGKAYEYLRSIGFKKVETTEVSVGGNY